MNDLTKKQFTISLIVFLFFSSFSMANLDPKDKNKLNEFLEFTGNVDTLTLYRTPVLESAKDVEKSLKSISELKELVSQYLKATLRESPEIVLENSTRFNWLGSVQPFYYFEYNERRLIVYGYQPIEGESCGLFVYRYTKDKNRKKEVLEKNNYVNQLFYGTTVKQKIELLESKDLLKKDFVILVNYCMQFPHSEIMTAVEERLDDFSDLPRNARKSFVLSQFSELQEDIRHYGNYFPPPNQDEEEYIASLNEAELINCLDNEDLHPKIRSLAFMKVLDFPSDEMIAAVKRNWHKPHEKKRFFPLDELIAMAKENR